MAKTIRPTYPKEFSIGMLLLIFSLSSFLSFEIFAVRWQDIMGGSYQIVGMLLSGLAVVFMAIILWEEFFFPVRIKPTKDEVIFKNHSTKLQTQVLIYCAIPIIIGFVYFKYEVTIVPFLIWAALCLLAPLNKLISGIKNYNDFLKLSAEAIEFKNNEKGGVLPIRSIQELTLIKDEASMLHKIQ